MRPDVSAKEVRLPGICWFPLGMTKERVVQPASFVYVIYPPRYKSHMWTSSLCPNCDRFAHLPYHPLAQLQMEALAPVLDVVKNRPYISSASVILGCVTLVRLARWRSRSRLPPGPKGLPIVGNLFDFDSTHVWEQFGAWGRQYGWFSILCLCPPHIIYASTWIWTVCTSRGCNIYQCSGPGHDNTQLI